MDWWKTNEGEYVWINDNSRSPVWEGWQQKSQNWQYIGKSYMGITIEEHLSWTNKNGRTFGEIAIYYNGENITGWIQTVDSNASGQHTYPTIDPPQGSMNNNYPYYHDDDYETAIKIAREKGYNYRLYDQAFRDSSFGNFYFRAETSLVKSKVFPLEFNNMGGQFGGGAMNSWNNGYVMRRLTSVLQYYPAITLQWEFGRANGQEYIQCVRVVPPSAFHRSAFGKIR